MDNIGGSFLFKYEMDNIILYALKEGLTPAIIVVIYLLIVKMIDSKREKANIKITNDLVAAINKISNFLDNITTNIIDKDRDKCRYAIRQAFLSSASTIIEFVTKTIINNHINTNRDNIINNVEHLVNAEYYNIYNSLSLYTIDGNKINEYLKEEWIKEIEKDAINIIFNEKLDKETKILTFNNRMTIKCQDFAVYVTNKAL